MQGAKKVKEIGFADFVVFFFLSPFSTRFPARKAERCCFSQSTLFPLLSSAGPGGSHNATRSVPSQRIAELRTAVPLCLFVTFPPRDSLYNAIFA